MKKNVRYEMDKVSMDQDYTNLVCELDDGVISLGEYYRRLGDLNDALVAMYKRGMMEDESGDYFRSMVYDTIWQGIEAYYESPEELRAHMNELAKTVRAGLLYTYGMTADKFNSSPVLVDAFHQGWQEAAHDIWWAAFGCLEEQEAAAS